MKIISEEMNGAKILDECLKKCKSKLHLNNENIESVKSILDECNIDTSNHSYSKIDYNFKDNSLTIAIAYIISGKKVPDEIFDIVESILNNEAIRILNLLNDMLNNSKS